jgi:hypothetical protein
MPQHTAVAVLAMALMSAGCVPTASTIGGHDAAELERWARQAKDACVQRTGQAPPYGFTTDGCTLSPDGTWQSCCVAHDEIYWCGGSARDRARADEQLRACIVDNGGPRIAGLMYSVVRVFGNPWLPVYWRWGYGWPWPRGYVGDPHAP